MAELQIAFKIVVEGFATIAIGSFHRRLPRARIDAHGGETRAFLAREGGRIEPLTMRFAVP